MNSHQRRKKRRVLNKAIRDHKNGQRGTWWYYRGSRHFNFEIDFYDDWISIYDLYSEKYVGDVVVSYYIDFPKWADKLSFLEPYKHPELKEYPAYKLKDRNYLLVPHDSGKGVRWIQIGKFPYSESAQLKNIPFEEVFNSLSDKEKDEAVWFLDVLSGE